MSKSFDYNSHIDMMRIEPNQPFKASYTDSDGDTVYVIIQGKPGCYYVQYDLPGVDDNQGIDLSGLTPEVKRDYLFEFDQDPFIPDENGKIDLSKLSPEELDAYFDAGRELSEEEDDDNITEDTAHMIIDYVNREWIERGKGKTHDSKAIGKIIERTFS